MGDRKRFSSSLGRFCRALNLVVAIAATMIAFIFISFYDPVEDLASQRVNSSVANSKKTKQKKFFGLESLTSAAKAILGLFSEDVVAERGILQASEEREEKEEPLAAVQRISDELNEKVRHARKARPDVERLTYLVYVDPLSTEWPEYEEVNAQVFPGDVFISGIPMVDQGRRPWCVVASTERVLASYGIDVDMEAMARLARTTAEGTPLQKWAPALSNVIESHGLHLQTVAPVTLRTWGALSDGFKRLIEDYNAIADLWGGQDFNAAYLSKKKDGYKDFAANLDYSILQETVLSNVDKCNAFTQNVIRRIENCDPLFWTVTTGILAERGGGAEALPAQDRVKIGVHMRLIIGYNEERKEILYSDSWGDGHELKRMSADDALSITSGLYFFSE